MQEITSALHTSPAFHTVGTSSYKVIIPPVRSITAAWPEAQQLVVLPHSCQATISSPFQAAIILLSLTRVVLTSPTSSFSINIYDPGYQWAFDQIRHLIRTISGSKTSFGSPTEYDSLSAKACRTVSDTLIGNEEHLHELFPSTRCISSFVEVVESLFKLAEPNHTPKLERELARLSISLYRGCRRSPHLFELFQRLILFDLAAFFTEDDLIESYSLDLQVRLSRYYTHRLLNNISTLFRYSQTRIVVSSGRGHYEAKEQYFLTKEAVVLGTTICVRPSKSSL